MSLISPTAAEQVVGLYHWNPAALELSWDRAAAAIFSGDTGVPPFDVWRSRVHPDDHLRAFLAFSQSTEEQAVYRIIMDDGTLRHVLHRVTEFDDDPRSGATRFTGVIIDVTASRDRDAMLDSVLDSSSDGFLMLDYEYHATYLNKQAAVILGATARGLLGSVLWDLFPEASPLFRLSFAKAMVNRVPVAFEAYYPSPLNMWLEVRVQPSSEGILICFQDVTERRTRQDERESLLKSEQRARAEADDARKVAEIACRELAHQATHDPLTDLMNRGEFERFAAACLSRRGSHQSAITVLVLNLDRFKFVNDSLGHAVGDAFLVDIASRIVRVVGSEGAAARLGGDEFVVLVDCLSAAAVELLCERMLRELREPTTLGGCTVSTTVSIGVASTGGANETSTLLRNADVAMYRAKDAGRDRFAWFDSAAHQSMLKRISLEGDLRQALDEGTIGVDYQPIFSLSNGRVSGVEALARWELPLRGSISPTVFIPIAEDAGLINQLGRHVARIAIAQAMRWNEIPDFTTWINVSGRQFATSRVADDLLRDLSESGLEPNRLGVEVTETALADEMVAVRTLRTLVAAGVSVAIDDFGTGYSSIARLPTLPISVLKIDRSFVRGIETSQGRAALDAIVHLAQALGMRTVAEGIETSRQLKLVREAGVTAASGYLLGRPAPANALARQLPAF